MKIVIAGAGAVGTHLDKLLSKEDQDISGDFMLEVINGDHYAIFIGSELYKPKIISKKIKGRN